MTQKLVQIGIKLNNDNYEINCVILNNKIIATSYDAGATTATIDTISSNLSDALGIPVTELCKLTDNDDFEYFDWEKMIEGAIDHCTNHVNALNAMPQDYEYNQTIYTFEELMLFISEEKHAELLKFIASNE